MRARSSPWTARPCARTRCAASCSTSPPASSPPRGTRASPPVLDLVPEEYRRLGLQPVGRLDKDTTGLLLLTNDGALAHRVISPKSGVVKTYLATTDGDTDGSDAAAFAAGLTLADGTRCLSAALEPLGGGQCLVRVQEGKYHQVKRMLAARGRRVLELRAAGHRRAGAGPRPGPRQNAGAFVKRNRVDICPLSQFMRGHFVPFNDKRRKVHKNDRFFY